MSVYPTSVITFTTKTNEVDDVEAAHVNTLQDEVIALQQYVGTNPHGSKNNLADRLNVMINGSGAINGGTGFPAQTTPMRLFYRTDSETLYIRRADNSAEQAIGGAPTNLLFSWVGKDDSDTSQNGTGQGLWQGPGINITAPLSGTYGNCQNLFFIAGTGVNAGDSVDVLEGKIHKISGISTVKMWVKIWGTVYGTSCPKAQLNINSGSIIGTTEIVLGSAPTWTTTPTIDISSLSNGTTYGFTIGLINGTLEDSSQSLNKLSKCFIFGA